MFRGKAGWTHLFLVFLLLALLIECNALDEGARSSHRVSFQIAVPQERFRETATVRVAVWNAGQLALRDQIWGCASLSNRLALDREMRCEEGAYQQQVTPEIFIFPLQDIEDGQIIFTSSTVYVGEYYRVHLSGLSQDGCTTTFTSTSAIARARTVLLDNLSWGKTLATCR